MYARTYSLVSSAQFDFLVMRNRTANNKKYFFGNIWDEERHEKAIKCSYAQHVLPIAVVYDQQYWAFFLENSTILCRTIDIICLCYVSVQWFRHSQHEFILCSKKIIFLFFALFVHCNIGIHKHQFLWLILLDPLAMYHSIFLIMLKCCLLLSYLFAAAVVVVVDFVCCFIIE